MRISELGLKAVIANLWGEIGFVGEMKEITGISKKTGKEFSFHTQFVVMNNVEGKVINPVDDSEIDIADKSIGINLTVHSSSPITKEMKGQTLSINNLTIHEYKSDDGVKRTLNASMPKKAEQPKQAEKTPVTGKKEPLLPDKDDLLSIVKDIQTTAHKILDFIELKQMEAEVVESTEQLDKLTEDTKGVKQIADIAVKVKPDNKDIIYNDKGLHIEAIFREEVGIWDITLYDIPAKSSFPPLPLELSGFAQTNNGKKTIVGQIISRLDKDPLNHKLIRLIREKCE